jgi:Uma2 family endonuclease
MAEAARKKAPPSMTVAEFLDWDGGTDIRYELLGGIPVAMAPSLDVHGELAISLGAEIRARLKPPCRVVGEAGLRLPGRDDTFYVCDLAVAWGPRGPARRYVNDPVVLVEVLSPSTAAHDRGDKAAAYRMIPSVQDIVLMSSTAVAAEIWRRTERGWLIEDIAGLDAVLHLSSVGIEVPLAAIYRDIPLEQPTAQAAAGTG